MAYPCVPYNPAWADNGTKLDLKAIYRRPNGDLATLPMRRHHQWEAKGFQYVTLADHDSLVAARPANARQYVVGLDGDGRETPWDAQRYLAERREQQAAEDVELAALVEAHGAETVEAIKGVKVPAHLKKGKAQKAATA